METSVVQRVKRETFANPEGPLVEDAERGNGEQLRIQSGLRGKNSPVHWSDRRREAEERVEQNTQCPFLRLFSLGYTFKLREEL